MVLDGRPGGHGQGMADEREYEDFDRLSGAEQPHDGRDDAFAEFSDELMESTGIGDDDPPAAKERPHRD